MSAIVLGSWSPATATIIAGRLRSEGIEVFPLPVDGSSLEGGPSVVHLVVLEEDAADARSVIAAAERHD